MKIQILLFAACCFFAWSATAQVQILKIRYACAYDDLEESNKDYYTFPGSEEANAILAEVMRVNVLEPNFILRSGDCKNALATTLNGQRYILYSTTFLESFKRDARTKWAAYSVLAHEVGHHLNNDKMPETNTSQQRLNEVKADQFSGGVLYRLGATLEEAQAGILSFSLEGGSETHPPKSARLEAVANGWNQAQEMNRGQEPENSGSVPNNTAAETWYNKGIDEVDDYKKIEYFTKAIEFKPEYVDAVNYRGNAKLKLGNATEAIKDYDRAIQLNPAYAKIYRNRGLAKADLDQLSEAIKDFDRAIQLDPDFTLAYYSRGAIKYKLDQYSLAIRDFDRAIQLDPNYIDAYYYRGFAKQKLSQYHEAIRDYDRCIQLGGGNMRANIYVSRGVAKKNLNQFANAIKDYDEAIRLDPNNAKAHCNKGCALVLLAKYHDAIESLNNGLWLDNSLNYAKDCLKEAKSKL